MHIVTPGAELFYQTYGTGPHALLLFHGAGQDHRLFEPLAAAIGHQYTCYAFDLYFHGRSHLQQEHPLSLQQWQQTLAILLERHNISTFTILGFSIGSRFALATLQAYPQHTRKLILVAPDALTVNPWYWLATYPAPMRWLFKKTISHPRFLFRLLSLMQTLVPTQRKLFRFAGHQMGTEEKRSRIYRSWTTFRKLAFTTQQLAGTLRQHAIPLVVITGLYDTVVPTHTVKKLLTMVPLHTLHTLPADHNRLLPEIAGNPARYFN